MMTKRTFDVAQELKTFRSQLFNIDKNDDRLKQKLHGILDKYSGEHFDTFAEEYLIASFDTEFLNDESRSKIQLLSNVELPSIRDQNVTYWDRDRLMFCLLCNNEVQFVKGFDLVCEKHSEEVLKLNTEQPNNLNAVDALEIWRNISLIKIAVIKDLSKAIRKLGSFNATFNSTAIHLVYEFGRWECLRKLLEKRRKMAWEPVKLVEFTTFLMRVQKYDKDGQEIDNKQIDFGKCVDLLFKYADYEVNEQNVDHSALHLAVMYNKSKTIMDLLKRGAYIGLKDATQRPTIWNINAKTLEKHFDNCITGENLVVFNYENLIAPSCDYPNDLTVIEFISQSNELRHLLEHPLIASFISLKWTRMALVFYIDFMLYFLLSLVTGLISMYYIRDPSSYSIPMVVITLTFIAYVAFRRLIQVSFCSSSHQKTWENSLNSLLTLSIIVFLVLFMAGVRYDIHRSIFATICIVLITHEFILLASAFWHFSIYHEMFITVATSSIQSLQLYAIFLPAFSLLFYILLCDSSESGRQQNGDTSDWIGFSTLGVSVIKTVVMSTGEFDILDMNFDASAVGILVFIGFIFLISTVFMNLLNGLAVSDTQKLQFDAELRSYGRRCQMLARYEDVLTNKGHWFRKNHRILWRICRCFIHLNNFVYQNKRIYIELDDQCKVYSVKMLRSSSMSMRVPLRSWTRLRTAPIDSKIIQQALQIRQRNVNRKYRERGENNDVERDILASRMARMEKSLTTIEATLKILTDKIKEN
ncbi:transient receptor potential cation channel protein painless-like [Contarinia nasturtii]|uniref:transient receptor potential cation channel protein painless-like n=1 Tax=Contarinia nasturtii TaxID=265458 RepID=UPI0012D386E1|nr:transient receptor potential cation channel protein painless-like [Contarinia nasturtii]